ncbi:hypothetical protein DSM112329_00617 [Paraconexibacter sp. AEG42_29]|uniref:MarR family transcriptional regulator n=1 Tax=Paraconexibacter sp. AEG42_29 TaxID=2997339 RepID=A0AAU7AQ97_9ACTN
MDAGALLDRCDAALGARGLRGHRWPWLRDDDGEPVVVDAFWPDDALAVVLVDPPASPAWVTAAETAAVRGITVVGLPPTLAGDSDERLLRMVLLLEPRASRSSLTAEGAAFWQRSEPTVVGVFMGDLDPRLTADWEDLDDDEDDFDAFDLGDDEDEDGDGDEDDDWDTPRVELGWRTRPLALAALGAVALANRAFADGMPGRLDPVALQLLVAVAVAEGDASGGPADDLAGLAARLGVRWPAELRHVQEDLVQARLIVATPPFDDGDLEPPSLTEAGREVVERWLAQVAPLFRDWPPEHPGVDDAVG